MCSLCFCGIIHSCGSCTGVNLPVPQVRAPSLVLACYGHNFLSPAGFSKLKCHREFQYYETFSKDDENEVIVLGILAMAIFRTFIFSFRTFLKILPLYTYFFWLPSFRKMKELKWPLPWSKCSAFQSLHFIIVILSFFFICFLLQLNLSVISGILVVLFPPQSQTSFVILCCKLIYSEQKNETSYSL